MPHNIIEQLRTALDSGKEVDYCWNGEDEVRVEIFNTDDALRLVTDVFKIHLKESFFAGREVENIHDIDGTTLAKDVKPRYSWEEYLGTLKIN